MKTMSILKERKPKKINNKEGRRKRRINYFTLSKCLICCPCFKGKEKINQINRLYAVVFT